MKNKISFTSVLKSKASSRMMNGSSQNTISNNDSQQSRYQQQHQHQRLIDIYQQYQCYPEQDYTLDLNYMGKNLRTRNSSLSNMMSKSNKIVNDDPEMSLEMWIESQKKGSYENYSNGNNFGVGISNGSSINSNSKFAQQLKGYNYNQQLGLQQEQQQQPQLYPPPINRRSRSTYNPPASSTSNNKNIYYQQNQQMQSSSSLESEDEQQLYQQQQQRYIQPTQQNNSNGFISGKWNKRSPNINQNNKPQLLTPQNNNLINELQSSSSSNHHHQENTSLSPTNKITPQDYLAEEMIRSKSHYPSELQDKDYDQLKEEFERLKGEKITELCMQAKKTIKKDKLKEIVNKALENIYDDIENMAEKMVEEKKNKLAAIQNIIPTKRMSNPNEQHSESMLISGGGYQAEEQPQQEQNNYYQQEQQQQSSQMQQTDRAQQQRRQQELRNMIKGYISVIQQAKTQGNLIRSKQHNEVVNNNKDCVKQNASNKNNQALSSSMESPHIRQDEPHQQQQQEQHEQHSFSNTNYQENTFNNQLMTNFNTNSENDNNNNQCIDNNSSAMDCVGYSFANNNNVTLGCEHSFNRDLIEGTRNSGMFYHHYNSSGCRGNDDNDHQSAFGKQQYTIKPQVYQPQQQSMYQQQQEQHTQQQFQQQQQSIDNQQRISLPNIEQVKSQSGQFPHEQQSHLNSQVQSSQQIQIRNKQLIDYDIHYENDNSNIKNIESVHYEPPASEQKYHGGYFQFNEDNSRNMMHNNNSRKDLFKNFQEHQDVIDQQQKQPQIIKTITQQKAPQNTQQQRFVSKTFNSYLNGNMRSEYGLGVKDSLNEVKSGNIMGSINKYSIGNSNSDSIPTVMRVSPITLYSPPTISKQPLQPTPASQSMNMSLNQSFTSNPLIQRISSPKSSYHIMQSKNKFSISSPMNKIQQIMSQEEHMMIKGNNDSYRFASPPYAVSSSITASNKMQQHCFNNNNNNNNNSSSIQNNIYANNSSINNNNKVTTFNTNPNHQYACSESISINNNNNNNSINFNFNKNSTQLQQSSSLSLRSSSSMDYNSNNNNRIVAGNQQQFSNNNNNNNSNNNLFEMKPLMVMSPKHKAQFSALNATTPKLAESIELSHPSSSYTMVMPTSPKHQQSITITYGNNKTSPTTHPTITSGRNFLQSLHEKQSIEIELSPSPNHQDKYSPSSSNYNGKQSFAAETFRPLREIETYSNQNQLSFKSNNSSNNNKEKIINGSNSNKSSNTKLSITKVTLKSSDKNHTTSPKVISLTVNHLQSQKQPPIQEFSLNNNDTKQNIFQKLTIKESFNNNSNNSSMSLRNSQSFGGAIQHQQQHNNYVNFRLKQNSNTMNNSIQNNNNNGDWRKQSMNQDKLKESLPINNINNPKSSIITIEKKQPLIKLSKNFTIPSTQQSSFNTKKSIGQSIRTKVHQPGMMITTKTNVSNDYGIGQSFNKYAMKQSIGNDSDMDFDLELD